MIIFNEQATVIITKAAETLIQRQKHVPRKNDETKKMPRLFQATCVTYLSPPTHSLKV